jgi:HK97 family phage prohead protease
MPAMLWQHDSAAPIGVWTEIAEDKRGLKLAGRIATGTTKGREALDLLRIGALKGLSIGFVSKKWSFDREKEVRTLTEVELWEVSLVTFPANPKASVTTVKGAGFEDIETPRDAERWLREAAGMSRDEAKTIVSRLMKLGADRRDAGESYQRLQQAADRLLSKFTSSGA